MRNERVTAAATAVENRDTAEATREQERLALDLQQLRDLLEEGRVEAARTFVTELKQRWPESERVQHYAHVLAPPKVRLRPDIPARSSEREWRWLEEHGREYPGCWLAIYEDRLIAADPDLEVVLAQTREALGEEGAFLFHQPRRREPRRDGSMSDERGIAIMDEAGEPHSQDELSDQERLAADLKRLRAMLEEGRIEPARAFVKDLEQRWPDAERVRHYAHVLAPPKVRLRPDLKLRTMDREWEWLRSHGHQYPGCWLAIYEDRLIAADPDRRVVVARARELVGDEGVLLFHPPGSPQPK